MLLFEKTNQLFVTQNYDRLKDSTDIIKTNFVLAILGVLKIDLISIKQNTIYQGMNFLTVTQKYIQQTFFSFTEAKRINLGY